MSGEHHGNLPLRRFYSPWRRMKDRVGGRPLTAEELAEVRAEAEALQPGDPGFLAAWAAMLDEMKAEGWVPPELPAETLPLWQTAPAEDWDAPARATPLAELRALQQKMREG